MGALLFPLLFLLIALSPIQAENTWIYPKPYTNPTFSSEDILEASWTSDFDNPTLLLLCDFAGPPCECLGERVDCPKASRLTEPIALNTSAIQSTGSYLVPLNYGTDLYACHLNLAEPTVHGGSMNSPNFNIRPNLADTPITWNSKSDSGPTTTTVTTSTSAPVSVLTHVATFTVTKAVAISSRAAVSAATSTRPSSLLPSSTSSSNSSSSPSQSNHPSVGIIVGASIAGLVGVGSLAVATLLYVRTRSRHGRESARSPHDKAPNGRGKHWSLSELTGLGRTELEGRQNLDGNLHGYPVAVGHSLPVGELEGR